MTKKDRNVKFYSWFAAIACLIVYLLLRMPIQNIFRDISTPIGIFNLIVLLILIINAICVAFLPQLCHFYTEKIYMYPYLLVFYFILFIYNDHTNLLITIYKSLIFIVIAIFCYYRNKTLGEEK